MVGGLRFKKQIVTPSDDDIVSVPFRDFRSVLEPRLYEHAYCSSVELPTGIDPGETAESWPIRLKSPQSDKLAFMANGLWTEKVVIDAHRPSEHRGIEIRTTVVFAPEKGGEERRLPLLGIGGCIYKRKMDIDTIYLGREKEIVPHPRLVTASLNVLSAVTSFINLSRDRQKPYDYLRQAARHVDKAFGLLGVQEVQAIRCLRMQLPGIPPRRAPRKDLQTSALGRIG